MSEHDLEALLGELRPAGLPAQADAEILAAIRKARGEAGAIMAPASTSPIYRKPVPAWAAAAACLIAGAVSWMAGAGSASHPRPTRLADDTRVVSEQPAVRRVHVESNVFSESPSKDLDISKWTPVTGHNRENRS